MTVRHVLIALNIVALVAIAAYLIWAVLSPKRASQDVEPANLTPFLPDEDLESRRLERVQGWALLFAAIVAIALPLYWLHEPSRQKESVSYFDENAAERGEELFSDPTMETFNSAVSLQCARCHGAEGQGGPVPFTLPNGQQVVWKAPPLNTVMLRFKEDPKCIDPDLRPTVQCSVTDIITFGRAGTPMPAWGVIGGGAKNDQSIQDLIAYLRTIQLTPAEAQKQAADELDAAHDQPAAAIKAAQDQLATDQKSLDTAATAARKALQTPDATEAELKQACDDIADAIESDPSSVNREQGLACRTYTAALATVEADQAALDWTRTWAERRANVSDGQLLFELNCARCHTAGWSTFDPSVPPDNPGGVNSLGLPGGGGGLGGGIGFNIRGSEIQRFGTDEDGGFDAQVEFVSSGSVPFKEYGTNGQGTGKMPGFGQMLTKDMIEQIVGYERYCVTESNYKGVDHVQHGAARATDDHHCREESRGVTVHGVLIIAAEGIKHPNLWNPTILGVLVTISAIGLFCGSVYLLLSTNLGARLGFLIAAASLTGFIVLLSGLWWTSGNSGIDPPHGRSPSWKVVEVVSDPQESTIVDVHNVEQDGTPVLEEGLANLRPAMDAALVNVTPAAGEEAPDQPLAKFTAALDYLTDFEGFQAWLVGGQTKNVFWHTPKYAVVQFCPKDPNSPIGEAPKCDPLEDKQFAVMSFDLGSLRQPVVFQFFIPSLLLFILSLLGLHWHELDARKRKRERALAPVPSSGS